MATSEAFINEVLQALQNPRSQRDDFRKAIGLLIPRVSYEIKTQNSYAIDFDKDDNKIIELIDGAGVAIPLSPYAPAGFSMTFVQGGNGQLTFTTSGDGVIKQVDGYSKSRKLDAFVTVVVRSNDSGSNAVWRVTGDLGV